MAKRLEPQNTRNAEGEEDLAILHPDRQIVVAGTAITVREFRFAESLRIRHLTAPIIQSLYEAFKLRENLNYDQVVDVLAQHAPLVTELIAVAADRDPAWVRALHPADGDELMLLWWVVNKDFFVKAASRRLGVNVKESQSAGQTSNSPSSNTAAPSN